MDGSEFWMLARLLLNRWTLSVLNLLILFPLVLAIVELFALLWGAAWTAHMHDAISQSEDLIEGVGVVLIGWGVALEERNGMAELLGSSIDLTDTREVYLSHVCHSSGLAVLVLGLFAEIAMEIVRLPDHIINTNSIERWPLSIAALFLSLAAVCLLVHVVRMIFPRDHDPHL
jgi:hypothetical protein